MSLKLLQLSVFLLLGIFNGLQNTKAEDISLLPKYGMRQKTEAQISSDKQFLSTIDKQYSGDRKKASLDLSNRGWEYLQQAKTNDAMRRFNQAWLLDPKNPIALWGMGAHQINTGIAPDAALKLLEEAEPLMQDNLNFSIDYAKTIGFAAAQKKSESLLKDALTRFANIDKKAPQNILNLQNWAITLFYAGEFEEAWKKIKFAEASLSSAQSGDTQSGSAQSGSSQSGSSQSGSAKLDRNFISALQAKMARPN